MRCYLSVAFTGVAVAALASPSGAASAHHHVLRHGPVQLDGGRAGHESSDNWAGYVAGGDSHSFKTVESHWTQPKVDCNSEGDASWWIGFDGWNSDSVEQTGADSVCDGDRASYYAWWEMYPAKTQEIDKPVKGGDKFYSKVTYSGNGKYTMYLKDQTQGWDDTEHATDKNVKDNSAEVIFEGVGPTSDAIPRFDDVNMSGNTVNGKPLSSFNPTEIDLVRNGNTLVTPGGFKDNGDFAFNWKAES